MGTPHLTAALRQLRSGLTFTLINGGGLAVGLATFLVVVLYVWDARHYDSFHERADRIVRVTRTQAATTPAPLAPALVDAFPSVHTATRILPTLGDVLIKNLDGERYYEPRFYFADSTTFDVFSFDLHRGDPRRALAETHTVVIAERIARKYFGDDDPMGRRLVFDVGFEAELTVTGVMADPPRNSHFRPDFLASMATFASFEMLDFADWERPYYHTYLVLDRPSSRHALEEALPAFLAGRAASAGASYRVEPLTRIHLSPPLEGDLEAAGAARTVNTFAAIAALLLLIACANYVNLTTARSAARLRAAGIRTLLGASRRSLVRTALTESVLLAAAALGLALVLAGALLPLFNDLADTALAPGTVPLAWSLPLLTLLLLAVGVGSGCYPALMMLRVTPLQGMQASAPPGSTGRIVRRTLVVLQFSAGIVLLVGTLVMRSQLRYVQTHDPGFDRAQTVVVTARTYGHATTPLPFESIRAAFAAQAGVRAVAATGDVPGTAPRRFSFLLDGMTDRNALSETNWNTYAVDFDFVETLGLEIVAGRSFDRERTADERNTYLVNEAAVRAARDRPGTAWQDPIGRKLDRYVRVQGEWALAEPGRVIGVVRDFHYASLHQPIEPLVLRVSRSLRDHLVVRLAPGDASEVLHHLEATWNRFVPERPFEYYFLDAAFDRQYRQDRRSATLLTLFSSLSLFVACLGLFGLAAFTAEQRTREIGIRKVLGASVPGLVALLTRDVLRLLALAFVIAVPVAYVALQRWLNTFAYQIEMSGWTFLRAGLVALLIAVLTVSYQTVRAALADPVKSLRET